MPSSQSGERRLIKYPSMPGAPPSDQDQQNPLPCPRCDSPNTKFCYYNNYNLAQPRHFCKSCRRYWTQGGTLRNVPVGGGTRKNAKRSRISSSPVSEEDPLISPNPISSRPIPTPTPVTSLPMIRSDVNLNIVNINASGGGFTSLLNGQSPGFLALNGFGLGISSGFEEMGFEIGKGVWPLGLPDVSETTNNIGGSGGGGAGIGGGVSVGVGVGGGGNTWQLGVGADGGFGENECFTWPELGISTPRRSVK